MIRTFADKATALLAQGGKVKRVPPDVQKRVYRKLRDIDAAEVVDDLRVPPGNRLEQLKGDRAGQWSIRVNDQWRLCFKWKGKDAWDVELVDYHD
jgi:proteic killer suppression protein